MKIPGIYVHLPFCAVHCVYCDFPLTTRLSLSDRYYEALLKEIEMHPPAETADTLYFGGGTPSITPVEMLLKLREKFSLLEDSEVTLEANPDDISEAALDGWKDIGINRLSIGVQSLEDPVLRWMLRKHNAPEALSSLHRARAAGFDNINVDLILGAPKQSVQGFLSGLNQLLQIGPEHFSLYLLEIHDRTALHLQLESGKVRLMAEEDQLECYRSAVELLQASGYAHYEVSNFACADFRSRHNLKYWTDAPYYAYGAGACSYLQQRRVKNLASISSYIEAVESKKLPQEEEYLEEEDTHMRNALIFGLRKTEGIDIHEFERAFGVHPLSLFDEQAGYLEEGFLEISGNNLRLSMKGLLLSNEILASVV